MKSLNDLIKSNVSNANNPLLKDVCMITMCGDPEPPKPPIGGPGGGIKDPMLIHLCTAVE